MSSGETEHRMDWLLTIIARAVQSLSLELKLQRHAIEELVGLLRESRK